MGSKNKAGYGKTRLGYRADGTLKDALAHRASYQVFVGEIPPGLTIDHLCKQPSCINPEHLEAVTMRENLLRGDTFQARNAAKKCCPKCQGPFTQRIGRSGRYCKPCRYEAIRKWQKKQKAQQ